MVELGGGLNIIMRRNSALLLVMMCQLQPFHLLSPAVSSGIHFHDLATKHYGTIDAFPYDALDADHPVHPFRNARESAPRSNAHSAPKTGLYENVGTATSDAPNHVSEVFTIRSYQNSQDL